MSDRLQSVPTLDELAAHPERVAALNREEVQRLLIRHAAAGTVLLGRLLSCQDDAARRPAPPPGPYLGAEEAATYLRVRKSRLDGLRRAGHLPATKLGKAYTYRREDLDCLADTLAARRECH